MANNYFNKALKLINNKPTISEMVQSGYLAYVYPQPTIDYACKVLTGRELKLYLQICGQANGFNGAIKFYSDKANIGSNHYSQIIDSLEKKGFIKHIKYESIEVLFPTEENNINESAEPQKGNQKRIIDNSIIDSQSGKNQENKEITKMGNIEEKLGKQQSSFGNGDSQNKGYNREININKENRENPPTKEKEFDILRQSSKEYKLKVDTICYIDMSERKRILEKEIRFLRKYVNKLKIGGYKIILDGSPQGKTAWMSKPYIGENEYRGYPAKTDEEILESIEICLNENMQLLAHCNGDEAAEQFIRCIEKFDKEDIKKIRPVMIHAQTIREDQLDKIKKLNIIPSFFVSHTYYWGDVHIKNLGLERAKNISPAKSAEDLAINYTFHQDTPVLSPNILESIWCSVNRATKEGIIIGEEQKIDVYSALKAVTINAAYQYKEEKVKGSIKEGKIANLIILDKNPLKINREEIKNIKVIKTFINGEEV